MTRRIFAFTLFLSLGASKAFAIRALDENYFAPSNPPAYNQGVEVLSPNFFDDTSGTLERSEEGKFACTTVWSRSARGEAAGVGKVAQNF